MVTWSLVWRRSVSHKEWLSFQQTTHSITVLEAQIVVFDVEIEVGENEL